MDPRTDRIVADATSLDSDLAACQLAGAQLQASLTEAEGDLEVAEQTLATRTAERDTALSELAACKARPAGYVPRFAGDPGPGMAYVGTGGGNSDPATFEANAGRAYGIRPTRRTESATAATRSTSPPAAKPTVISRCSSSVPICEPRRS